MQISKRARTAATLLAALALAGASLPARAATTHSCGGFAPSRTACQTGTFTNVVSHDVAADLVYAGTVESTLVWSGEDRVFRCTYTQALRRACVAFGDFPPATASFTHRCRSLVPGTAIPFIFEGVQGGAGTWSCSVTI